MDEPVLVSAPSRGGERRRLVVLLGIGLALALVLLVAPRLLGGSGGDASVDDLSTPFATTTTTVAPTRAQPAGRSAGRDPFQPLVRAAPPQADTPGL